MDYEGLYCSLEELFELEEEMDGQEIKIDDPRLQKHHRLLSLIPILSPEDLIEYHQIMRRETEKEVCDGIKEGIDDYKKHLRERLGIEGGGEEENDEDIVGYVQSKERSGEEKGEEENDEDIVGYLQSKERSSEEKGEEEDDEDIVGYVQSKKAQLLRTLQQKCSPGAYEAIENIVNQIFP